MHAAKENAESSPENGKFVAAPRPLQGAAVYGSVLIA
jgi:hypothetical protein